MTSTHLMTPAPPPSDTAPLPPPPLWTPMPETTPPAPAGPFTLVQPCLMAFVVFLAVLSRNEGGRGGGSKLCYELLLSASYLVFSVSRPVH